MEMIPLNLSSLTISDMDCICFSSRAANSEASVSLPCLMSLTDRIQSRYRDLVNADASARISRRCRSKSSVVFVWTLLVEEEEEDKEEKATAAFRHSGRQAQNCPELSS